MSAREVEEFKSKPCAELCVKLRKWDDLAKVVGVELPQIETFKDLMLQCVQQNKTQS